MPRNLADPPRLSSLAPSVPRVEAFEPRPRQVLGAVKVLEELLRAGVNDLDLFDHLQVLLGNVGDLGHGAVPGVDQDAVVGLGSPGCVVAVHLLEPLLRGPGGLVPADDHPVVTPKFVLDHLEKK